VSIIPGIERGDPDRTETSNGSLGSPNERPMTPSSRPRCLSTSADKPAGGVSVSLQARHASVVIVNPGGTGKPRAVMAARFAPLPPSSSIFDGSPSPKS
jgi:hypothetical protein